MFCSISLFSSILVAQNTPWKLNGNNISNGKYVGTNNNQDLIFKSNGLEGFRLKSSNNKLVIKSIAAFQQKTIFKSNTIFKLLKDTTALNDRFVGIDVNGKLKVIDTSSIDYLTILNQLQIGSNTLFLGSDNSGLDNYIYTTAGDLRINANEGQGIIQNTEINPDGGKIAIGTKINDPIYGFNPSNTLYKTIIKHSLLVTGSNSTMGFVSDNTPNYHGDNAMCLEIRPNGHPQFPSCTNPIRGLNFFRPFATGQDRANGNFDLFISSLANSEGFVGVGTPYPKYRLSVNGTVGAREVIVETTAWCDYVFEKDYQLMPLSEVEVFIKNNKHLPEVPSESKVIENGQKLAEINKLLLKKVEELTLYIIDIEKRLQKVEQ